MEKVSSSVLKLIDDFLCHVAQEESLSLDTLRHHCSLFFDIKSVCICKATVKTTGLPCTNKAMDKHEYCRRHMHYDVISVDAAGASIRPQCTGINANGTRCVRDAKTGHELCAIHISKELRMQRIVEQQHTCIYYEEVDNSSELLFCNAVNMHQKWMCIDHKHLEKQYKKMFQARNFSEYVHKVGTVDGFKENHIVEEYRKQVRRS